MDILLGVLAAALFFVGYFAYKAGRKASRPKPQEMDEDEKRQAKQMSEHFEQLMNYDVNKALARKKVI